MFTQKELFALFVGTFPNTPADVDAVDRPPIVEVPTPSPVKPSFACDNVLSPVRTNSLKIDHDSCLDVLFTCPDDGLVLSQYPWRKSAVLKVYQT